LSDRGRVANVASYRQGERSTGADRQDDELQAHRRSAANIRIHRAQTSREHHAQTEPEDDGPIDGARDRVHTRGDSCRAFSARAGKLRPREIEIVGLVANGLTSKEIARKLRISPLTVRKHRENAMRKLDIHSMAELMRFARALRDASTPSEP
jgi:DNA-binding CsgD family transcriptional regulator